MRTISSEGEKQWTVPCEKRGRRPHLQHGLCARGEQLSGRSLKNKKRGGREGKIYIRKRPRNQKKRNLRLNAQGQLGPKKEGTRSRGPHTNAVPPLRKKKKKKRKISAGVGKVRGEGTAFQDKMLDKQRRKRIARREKKPKKKKRKPPTPEGKENAHLPCKQNCPDDKQKPRNTKKKTPPSKKKKKTRPVNKGFHQRG